jgi:hypothetical protein
LSSTGIRIHDDEALNRLRIIARERVADPHPDIVAHQRITFVAQLSRRTAATRPAS